MRSTDYSLIGDVPRNDHPKPYSNDQKTATTARRWSPVRWKGEEDEVGTASWSEGADRPKTLALEVTKAGNGWERSADAGCQVGEKNISRHATPRADTVPCLSQVRRAGANLIPRQRVREVGEQIEITSYEQQN
jgi:hypothetical protein